MCQSEREEEERRKEGELYSRHRGTATNPGAEHRLSQLRGTAGHAATEAVLGQILLLSMILNMEPQLEGEGVKNLARKGGELSLGS